MSTLTVSIVALVVFVVGAVVMFNLWQARSSRRHGSRGRAGHRISSRGWLDGWGGGNDDRDEVRGRDSNHRDSNHRDSNHRDSNHRNWDDPNRDGRDADPERGRSARRVGGRGSDDDPDGRATWPSYEAPAGGRRSGADRDAHWVAGGSRRAQDDPGAWTRERLEPTLLPDDEAVAARSQPGEVLASGAGLRADHAGRSRTPGAATPDAAARESQDGSWYVSGSESASAIERQVREPAVGSRQDWATDEDLGPPQFEVPRFDPVAPEALRDDEMEEPVRPPSRATPQGVQRAAPPVASNVASTAAPKVAPNPAHDRPGPPIGAPTSRTALETPTADSDDGEAAPAYVPAEVDHSVTLVPRASVNAERLIALTSPLRHVGSKAIRIEMATGGARWMPLQSGVMVGRLRCSVLLANRQGPLNAVELSDFSAAMESLARRIGADFVPADMNQVLRRARELDAVAAKLDTQVELGVEASAPITAQKLASVARKLQLVERGGRFACYAPGGDLLFTLTTGETSDLLAFVLDVPRTAEEHDPWRRMVDCASSCAKLTGGRVVDSVGRGMSVALIDNVGLQIGKRYRELAEVGLKAGSPSSLRVFN